MERKSLSLCPLLNESCCMKTYVKAWYCAWYDMRFVEAKAPKSVGRRIYSCMLLVIETGRKRKRKRWRDGETINFAVQFIILLSSRHLGPLEVLFWKERDLIPIRKSSERLFD